MRLYSRIKRSLNLSKVYECRGIKIDIQIKDNVTIKDNLEYSIVHQLYTNNYINSLQFSFEENSNKEGGMFHIGELSEETQIKIKSINKGVIKVREGIYFK